MNDIEGTAAMGSGEGPGADRISDTDEKKKAFGFSIQKSVNGASWKPRHGLHWPHVMRPRARE
jgi:hypothetical protein